MLLYGPNDYIGVIAVYSYRAFNDHIFYIKRFKIPYTVFFGGRWTFVVPVVNLPHFEKEYLVFWMTLF